MCSHCTLILLSSKMFGLCVFLFLYYLDTRSFLLHANSNLLFVGVNKGKGHGGTNPNTRMIVNIV